MKLARVYMTRVAAELEHLAGSDREPVREFLLLQGVRFAFRVHQVQNSFLSFCVIKFKVIQSSAQLLAFIISLLSLVINSTMPNFFLLRNVLCEPTITNKEELLKPCLCSLWVDSTLRV